MATLGKTKAESHEPAAATAHSSTRLYYAGTKRLPNLPDGREVWQALVGGLWRTYYEMPLDGTDITRIRRIVAVGVRIR